jgi:flagellar biosynthesis/type III secretory pathway protein FliH
MWVSDWRRLVLAASSCVLLVATSSLAQDRGGAYDRGFREGVEQGMEDARRGRGAWPDRSLQYSDADRGYQIRDGNRSVYRSNFRRGFTAGYRTGYDRGRSGRYQNDRGDRRDRRPLRGFQEPAVARGYSDGWEKGQDDGRDRDRYDPARHSDYRNADEGYSRDYGSKETYRTNYRTGFRQGYEEGYREGTRRRR